MFPKFWVKLKYYAFLEESVKKNYDIIRKPWYNFDYSQNCCGYVVTFIRMWT